MSVPEPTLEIVRSARIIAIVGLSPDAARPSHGVGTYLQAQGYRILPVTPRGGPILGQPAFPDLPTAAAAVAPERIDIVDVFRRPEHVAALLPDILAVHPKLVWLQLGIRDDATAAKLEAAGISVVQDHCLGVEHSLRIRR
ncbi:MAG TPA: CoA-binding protein [Gemmatimonadales bacterium]|nr:CoA-binding protein [Gemmatimonadales bacterium]